VKAKWIALFSRYRRWREAPQPCVRSKYCRCCCCAGEIANICFVVFGTDPLVLPPSPLYITATRASPAADRRTCTVAARRATGLVADSPFLTSQRATAWHHRIHLLPHTEPCMDKTLSVSPLRKVPVTRQSAAAAMPCDFFCYDLNFAWSYSLALLRGFHHFVATTKRFSKRSPSRRCSGKITRQPRSFFAWQVLMSLTWLLLLSGCLVSGRRSA